MITYPAPRLYKPDWLHPDQAVPSPPGTARALSTDRGVRLTMGWYKAPPREAPDMSPVAPPRPTSSLAAPEVYRLTVDEYERLAEAGVLDDPRVELIDGLLVRK